MRQLSGLDAGFLTLETKTAPMLIGSVSILDPTTSEGRLTVESFRSLLRKRLQGAVALRRRLASLPLDLSRPYWVELEPEEIDLEVHVERTQLPEPGGWHELSELMAFELSRPLDRKLPLWQILFVEGLQTIPGAPEDAVALIARVHHAAIDGVSGAEILGALFDIGHVPDPPVEHDPEPPSGPAVAPSTAPTPPTPPIDAPRPPRTLDLLARAGRDLASLPRALPAAVGRSLLGLAGGAWSRLRTDGAPPRLFSAPRTRLNRPIVGERSWAPAIFEFDRLKAIKNAQGATVNDVVLSVCAGALRGWLDDNDDLPEEPLVAMVPVSVRAEEEKKRAGNLVSAMLVALATNEADPLVRLQSIRDSALSSKVALRAVGARTLVRSAELLPFALSGLGVRLYSRLHLAEHHRPMFNLVITNVPGPPRPLTVGGARMLMHVGAAPLFDGLGLILPVFSYAGQLSIGVTADRKIMPDAAGFAARLAASLDELERAAL
ncbi:MAG: wax ester/triacylglycerol synthase family O-acyltransferase [Acidobacteria bacterium]|nr:wax ester/triacylglycerol synthase family O-acyltransferase [Acidobacteriota bacterium]